MLFPVLLVLGLQLSYGQCQSLPGTFNFRNNCTSQRSSSKYKVSCDGSEHFKDKNLVLDSQSVFGITDIELYSFESINIISQTSSDWDKINNITIRNCSKTTFSFQSNLRLNELKIDTVDEVTIATNQSDYSINSKLILLSNVGKLNLPYSNNSEIKSSVLTFNNIKDVNLYGKLQLSGEILTISQCNIDLKEHSTLVLKFPSITVEESTKLYIQENGQFNVSTYIFLIQESYIYMDGHVNISGYEFSGDRKVIKFLHNSIYGMKKDNVHIYGDRSEIGFIDNGIYRNEIGDVMALIVATNSVNFTKNHFGCNKCANRQLIQAKYLIYVGEENFCDSTCNLTLTTYKTLLDQGKICNNTEVQVDDKTLCYYNSLNVKSDSVYFWWTLITVITVSLVCLSILSYFYFKTHSPRFRQLSSVENANVLAPELQNSQENQKLIVRAFNNGIYGQFDNNSENT